MRDRETDSWWAIMHGRAIGGSMEGRPLEELPFASKTTWGEWRRRHPETLVLTVGGQTHVPENHYDNYFSSDRTFRGMKSSDERLPAKEPIHAFRTDGGAFALPHRATAGGHLFALPDSEANGAAKEADVFAFRERGASVFASTRAWQVPRGLITRSAGGYVVRAAAARAGELLRLDTPGALEALGAVPGVVPLSGFDTYWYTWIAAHPQTALLE
jgi:hypothetical protein